MTDLISAADLTDLGLDDWRVLRQGIEANFACGSYSHAGQFAADIAILCDEQNHHASIDIRYPDVVHVVSATHYLGGITDRDVTLAQAVSGLATDRGHASSPTDSTALEIAIDAIDIDAVRPFWEAVLDYQPQKTPEGTQVTDLMDPRGIGPAVWFQQMGEPRPQRNRIHVDVVVSHDEADARLERTLAAGGRLLSDARARAFWVLADAEGNEACICTWQDRG